MSRAVSSRVALGVLAAAAIASTGCYRVTVTSGLPASPAVPAINGASRGGYFNGIFEDDPVHVAGVCTNGWSSVHIETGFLDGLVDSMRGIYYHVDNITVVCAPDAPKAVVATPATPPPPAPASAPPTAPPVAPAEPAPVTAAL